MTSEPYRNPPGVGVRLFWLLRAGSYAHPRCYSCKSKGESRSSASPTIPRSAREFTFDLRLPTFDFYYSSLTRNMRHLMTPAFCWSPIAPLGYLPSWISTVTTPFSLTVICGPLAVIS